MPRLRSFPVIATLLTVLCAAGLRSARADGSGFSGFGSVTGARPTHISWTRSAGGADSPWTRILESFDGSVSPALGSGLTLADNGDGSGRLTVKKNPSDYAATFSGGGYGFAPEDYPYLRLRMSAPAAGTMTFGALPDWEDPSVPTSSRSLDYAASAGLAEIRGRFANVPTHVQQGRYTDAGLRFDPVAASPAQQRSLDIDYIAVDSHPVLGIDEFDMDAPDPAWTSAQLTGLGTAAGILSGNAGSTGGNARFLSRPVALDGEYWNLLELRLARQPGAMHGFALAWKDASAQWYQIEILPLADDGQFHYYQIDLAKCPEWSGGEVTEIRLDPYSPDPANNSLAFQLDYLRLRHMPVMGLGDQTWSLNLSAEAHVAKWNTGNALARYASTSLAIWNNPGGDYALRTNWARLAKERNLRLTCTIQSAKFFEGPADYDGDGLDEYRIPRDGNGDPSPQLAAGLAFAHIKQLALDMGALGYDDMYIGFDGLLRYLMFPTYRLDQDDTSGGFYEAAGNTIDQSVYDQCARTVILLMQMCAADPATQNFRFRIYPNLHMWEWEGMPRDLTRDIVSCGNFRPLVDAVHAANTAAFPAGDSPLIIFDADYPANFVKFGNKCRKLVRYLDYAQDLGYLVMCNAVETYDAAYGAPGILSREGGHAAALNFVDQILAYGGRPDIINSSWWQGHWDGQFDTAAVTEEDTADYSLASLWPKLMDRFTADTATRVFNESLPEFNNSGTPDLLILADGIGGESYAASLAAEALDPDPDDTLVFSKLSGPAWLQVAPDGSLSGAPGPGDTGVNTFRILVSDGRGGIDETELEINVWSYAESWRDLHFGTTADAGNAADGFDYDGDGSLNLFERAFATDPTGSASSYFPVHSLTELSGNRYYSITYRRLSGGTGTTGVDYTVKGLRYRVETNNALTPPWLYGSAYVEAVGLPVDNGDGTETVTVRLKTSITEAGTQFIRLNVE